MRFMVIVRGKPEYEQGAMPRAEELREMGQFNEELIKAGVMLAGEGLQPTSKGARIRFSGGKPTVTDGPFTEAKELVAGFWLIQAKSKEEAIAWMSRAPFQDQEIELRQIFEADDFGDALAPEMRERDERLRAQLGTQQ